MSPVRPPTALLPQMFWSRVTSGALPFYTRSNSMVLGERENTRARGDMTGEGKKR